MKNIKITVLVAGIGVVLLLSAIIFSVTRSKDSSTDPTVIEETTKKPVDITGTWYSNRPDEDVLTLNSDGSYSSSVWLAAGKYIIENNTISLTDPFGTTKSLVITKDETGLPILLFDNAAYSHSYYQTKAAAEQSMKKESPDPEVIQELQNAAAINILIGQWISADGYTDLTIAETEMKSAYKGIEINGTVTGAETTVLTYEITDIKLDGYSYVITADFKNNKTGVALSDVTIKITENAKGGYTIKCDAIPYSTQFDRVDPVPMEIPENSETITGDSPATPELPAEEAPPHAENPPNQIAPMITHTQTQISRNDNPDYSSHIDSMNKAVEERIYGTWIGWFGEFVDENTVFWQFNFNKDGTYSFTDGTEYTESGTFNITHDNTRESYPHELNMQHDDSSITQRFFIYGKDSYSMVIENSDLNYPTFIKQ